MKLNLFIFSFLISTGLFAQTTRKTVEDPLTGIKEKYNVLKADEQIKQGKYAAYRIFHNQLICEGYYQHNFKDSLWTYYNMRGEKIESGYYKNGKKVGIWEGLRYNLEPSVKYDFTVRKLLFYKPEQAETGKTFLVFNGKDTSTLQLEQGPIYLEGSGRFLVAISTSLRYPAKARENNTQGKVIIAFKIDENGTVSNYRIKKGIGDGCDEEALRCVKLIEGDWLPGQLNGKAVAVEYNLPLNFTLSDK